MIPTAQRTQGVDDAAVALMNAYDAFCAAIGYVPYTEKVSVKTDTGSSDSADLVNVDNEGSL